MINVTAIAFTGYPVTDMPRARAFYEGLLGLKPGDTWEHDGRSWIEYDLGPATLAISNMSAEWKPSSDGPVAALEVVDFAAAMAKLRENNIRFTFGPADMPTCEMAIVLDPDGNSLAIHRRKAG